MADDRFSQPSFPAFPDLDAIATSGTHPPAPLEEGPDPFDPDSLRLPPEMAAALSVKSALTEIPVRRPSKEWFFRVHSDEHYHLVTAIIELKEDRETFLVAPALWEALKGESTFTSRFLYLCINRQQVPFFWPLRPPVSATSDKDRWARTALEAAEIAMSRWVRLQPDMSLGGYTYKYAEHDVEPLWPPLSMRELLRIAFKDRFVDSFAHPILRQLRGEV